MIQIDFDYFSIEESGIGSFYSLPKMLLENDEFETIPIAAKVIYTMLLDRMSLSRKNKWIDDEDKLYIIYRIDELVEKSKCSKRSITTYLTELEKHNLIDRKRRGHCEPNVIYVKNFARKIQAEKSENSSEIKTESQAEEKDHANDKLCPGEIQEKNTIKPPLKPTKKPIDKEAILEYLEVNGIHNHGLTNTLINFGYIDTSDNVSITEINKYFFNNITKDSLSKDHYTYDDYLILVKHFIAQLEFSEIDPGEINNKTAYFKKSIANYKQENVIPPRLYISGEPVNPDKKKQIQDLYNSIKK